MADVKREQELIDRQKDHPTLDLPSDHPLRKLISRFRKKSDRNLLSPYATANDLELGEASSIDGVPSEERPRRKSSSIEEHRTTASSDLAHQGNCAAAGAGAALTRRGTLMPGAVPSGAMRLGSWCSRRAAVAPRPPLPQQKDQDAKPSDAGGNLGPELLLCEKERSGEAGGGSIGRSALAEASGGGSSDTSKNGELLLVARGGTSQSLPCSTKRPASKWGKLLGAATTTAPVSPPSSSAVIVTPPVKVVVDEAKAEDISSDSGVDRLTVASREAKVKVRRKSDASSESGNASKVAVASPRKEAACRLENPVSERSSSSFEQHVYELLRDLKSEIFGVHQRIQRVETRLEDVFKLLTASTAESSSFAVTTSPSSPTAWFEYSLKSSSSRSNQSQQPKCENEATDRTHGPTPGKATSSGLPFDSTDLRQEATIATAHGTEAAEGSYVAIPQSPPDSKPPELFPRRPSTRGSTGNSTKRQTPTRKRAPLSPPKILRSDSPEMHLTSTATDADGSPIVTTNPEICFIDTEDDPLIRVSVTPTGGHPGATQSDDEQTLLGSVSSNPSLLLFQQTSTVLDDIVDSVRTRRSDERREDFNDENESIF